MIVKQFRPALTICHLSFEHFSWKHRDDILTNSCHIISSLVGTVSNIVFCSDDQRIDSVQVCKFGRRATVTSLPKLYQLSSGFNNLEGKPLSFSVHQMIKEHNLVMSPTFDFGPLSQSTLVPKTWRSCSKSCCYPHIIRHTEKLVQPLLMMHYPLSCAVCCIL